MTNTDQFALFMAKYQDMVFSTACRLIGNQADAQDISQNVFLKAYQHFAQLADNPAAGGWLKTTATNLSLNHLSRYRARWRFFSEFRREEEDADFSDHLPAPPSFEESLPDSDYRALLDAVIQKLPNAQRLPLVLYHFEELSYDEIAARLRISLSKVKTDIHRARQALKKYLKPELLRELQGEPAPQSPGTPTPPEIRPRRNEPPFAQYALRYEPGF
jgi:RNA polymerase sigma-70 factor (ECF subfamily)